MKRILLDAPNVGTKELASLAKAVKSTYVSTAGPHVPEFEKRFARYLGVRNAVSTQSGTAALHIALHEAGITKADEVIVPALTFVATINPVLYLGARPVIVDVDPKTWTIDPKEIAKAVTSRTKAILPVHLYGNPCAMEEILAIARKHRLTVIEDATESLGATYKGKYTGTIGDFGCFSFNGNKIITTGGGGMVVAKSAKCSAHIKLLVNQGKIDSEEYHYEEVGFNYRMTNLEAALGLAQLKRLNQFLSIKKMWMRMYQRALGQLPGVRFQQSICGCQSSHWLCCMMLEKNNASAMLQQRLKDKGVPTRRIFKPLSTLSAYARYTTKACTNAQRIYAQGLCLPSATVNSPADMRNAIRTIKEELTRIL